MTCYPAINAAQYYRETATPKWFGRLSATNIDEGSPYDFRLNVTNWVEGAQFHIWSYGSMGASGWRYDWQEVYAEAAKAVGLTYTPHTFQEKQANGWGVISGIFRVGPFYSGGTMVASNILRKDRRTNNGRTFAYAVVAGPPTVTSAGVPKGTTGTSSLSPFYEVSINDTSLTPVGNPKAGIRAFDIDGVSPAKASYEEGESFLLEVFGTELTGGTGIKCFVANVGQTRLAPSFRSAILKALEARPDLGYTYSIFPRDADSFYQGATIFPEEANFSLRIPVTLRLDTVEHPVQQVDFIASAGVEGDLANDFNSTDDKGLWNNTDFYKYGDLVIDPIDGQNYVYLNQSVSKGNPLSNSTYWRTWIKTQVGSAKSISVKDKPPRYWYLRATSDGSTITYTLNGPLGVGSSVKLDSYGTVPPAFYPALAAACAARPQSMDWDGSRLHSKATTYFDSEITFTIPHPSLPGKHVISIRDKQGHGWITIGDAVVFLTKPQMPVEPYYITGMNLASGEFGRSGAGGGDVYGTNYRYQHRPERPDPATRHPSMDYHWDRGARLMRLPFLNQRIQDELFGPLMRNDPPTTAADRADMWRIDECIHHWTKTLGGWAALDMHNFGNMRGGSVRFDFDREDITSGVSPLALCDLWAKLADRYADNTKVYFNLMNEPNGSIHSPQRNADNMQWVVNYIRAYTDATNLIIFPGTDYSSAERWVTNGNADSLVPTYDPLDNMVYEVHCYWDADGSGTKGTCKLDAWKRLIPPTEWAREHGRRLFLGETGSGSPTVSGQQQCGVEMPKVYKYVDDNKDAWFGLVPYFGGDMWGAAFIFTYDPAYPADLSMPTTDNPQMQMLRPWHKVIM